MTVAKERIKKQHKTISLFHADLTNDEKTKSKWIHELLLTLEQLIESFKILEKPLIQMNRKALRYISNFFTVLALNVNDNLITRNAIIEDFFDRFKMISVPHKSFIVSTFHDYNKKIIEANINIIKAPPHPYVSRFMRRISRDHSLGLTDKTRKHLFDVVHRARIDSEKIVENLKTVMNKIETHLEDASFPEEMKNLKTALKEMIEIQDRNDARVPKLMDIYLKSVYNLNKSFFNAEWIASVKGDVHKLQQQMENLINIHEKLPILIRESLPEPALTPGFIYLINKAKLKRVNARFEEIVEGIDTFIAEDLKGADPSMDESWITSFEKLMNANEHIFTIFKQGNAICSMSFKTVNLLKALFQSNSRTKNLVEPINTLNQFLKYFIDLQLPFTEGETRADYFYSNHLFGFYADVILSHKKELKPTDDLYRKIVQAHQVVEKANAEIHQTLSKLFTVLENAANLSGRILHKVIDIRNALAEIRQAPIVVKSAQKDELDRVLTVFENTVDEGIAEFEEKQIQIGDKVFVSTKKFLMQCKEHIVACLEERNRIQSTLPEELENYFKQNFRLRTMQD